MARQTINTGSIANDGTGDTLRTAGTKINQNFREVYILLGGDSANIVSTISLTDSSILFQGVNYDTKLAFDEGTANSVITLPSGVGTVVTDTSTNTLTNKTLDSADLNNPVIFDLQLRDADDTNTFHFVPAHIASDRNVNIPAITDSDTFVFAAHTQTLTNKTFTEPYLDTPLVETAIEDENGAPIIKFSPAANAVREITINNADASGNVGITASGAAADPHVTMNLRSKGSGAIRNDKMAYEPSTITANGTVTNEQTYIDCNKGSTLALTMDNGYVTGEIKIFTNRGSGTANVTPTSFAHGTSFSVPTNASCQLIWDGNNWFMTGSQGVTIT